MKDIVILGAGGFAREALWVLKMMYSGGLDKDWNPIGFIDENPESHGQVLCGLPVLGGFDRLAIMSPLPYAIHGVGNNATRRKLIAKASATGVKFGSGIHPDARYSEFVELGEGTVVCMGAALTTQIKVGKHCLLNLHCTVGHDVVIEDFCNLAPGVHISGGCYIEEGVEFGTGAVVLPGLRIGANSMIGAGAVVNKSIPPYSVAVGVPAKVIKTLPRAEGVS